MKFGDIELLNASIYNLKVESLTTDPIFDSSEVSRIYYNNSDNKYRFNNGTEYVDLSLPNNFMVLVDSLGDNWVNSDFTFDPTPFNALHNVTGLTSNSSLFNVISQLDSAIYNLVVPELAHLQDVTVPGNIIAGDILFYDTNGFTFTDINTLIASYSEIGINNLHDVNVNTLVDGGTLIYNEASQQYIIAKPSLIIKDLYNITDHTITHNLGVMYVGVQIVNPQSNTIVSQATVTYVDENSLNITLAVAQPILVILTVPYGS